MTSIEVVASYLPETRVLVSDYLRQHGMSKSRILMHERFFGFSTIPLDPDAGLADHLVHAVRALPDFESYRPRIRYVIQARTMPVVAPHPVNPLRDVCARLELSQAHAFCLTQHACASGLLAVEVAGRLLETAGAPDALALLMMGEKAFTAAAKVITDTGVMGEGTVAVLVSAVGKRDRVLGYAARTHGKFHGGAWMEPDIDADFHADYHSYLAEVMTAAVEQAGLGFDEVDLILPHNVNRMSWLRVLKSLGIRGTDRLYLDNLASCGHCFGADSFINYQSALREGRIGPGDRCLMTAVGLGATFASMVFQH
jgi:3-oxoacyl-[acyl-carrier-protein] synthase III